MTDSIGSATLTGHLTTNFNDRLWHIYSSAAIEFCRECTVRPRIAQDTNMTGHPYTLKRGTTSQQSDVVVNNFTRFQYVIRDLFWINHHNVTKMLINLIW